jgi:c-di-AMP phosphodiesterase-like protein
MNKMNQKLQKFIEPSMRLYLLVLVCFAAVSVFFDWRLAAAEGGLVLVLVIYSMVSARRKRRELVEYIESVTYNVAEAKNDTLMNFPLPMVVFRLDDSLVVWGNQSFFKICGRSGPSFEAHMEDLVPGFSGKWLLEGKTQYPGLLELSGRKYQLHGNIVRASKDEKGSFMGITYWVDVTDYDAIQQEYEQSRPVVALIVLDNYDELIKNVPERMKNDLRNMVEDKIGQWLEGTDGILRRFDRDRYVYIFEARHYAALAAGKFALLEMVRDVVSPTGIHATVSIGIGRDGETLVESYNFASLAMEMALSRGGDQAVIKNRYNFEFFGGRGSEVETRTKVKSRVTANALAELIRDSSRVYVMGHKYGDLDCVGAAAGIVCMCRKLETPVHVVIDMKHTAAGKLLDVLRRVPEYAGVFLSPEDAMIQADSRSLLVVVDTNRPEQVEDEDFLQACNRVAVIDHHRRAATYIQDAALTFHEPYASSVCELITELLQEIVEQPDILRREAEAILSGIVMDTKNFTIRTGERTFEAAAFLRRAGADTTEVKKLLQNDLEDTVARYKILQSAKLYKGLAVAVQPEPQDRVVAAQAADELLNISGVQASVVVCASVNGGCSISARSIGDVNVQVLLEKLGGGGNKSAAGVQFKDVSVEEAAKRLRQAIDEYFDEES